MYQIMNLGPKWRRAGGEVGTKPGHHYHLVTLLWVLGKPAFLTIETPAEPLQSVPLQSAAVLGDPD